MEDTKPRPTNLLLRVRVGLILVFVGLLVFIFGTNPNLVGLDRSPVMGFIQIAVFLSGLAMICLGGYVAMNALWNGQQKSILADIGLRLVATGYVIAIASGLADVLGFGNHPLPQILYFGPWQALGVMVGEVTIALGFLFMIPRRRRGVE
jgi:hypothetical protein